MNVKVILPGKDGAELRREQKGYYLRTEAEVPSSGRLKYGAEQEIQEAMIRAGQGTRWTVPADAWERVFGEKACR